MKKISCFVIAFLLSFNIGFADNNFNSKINIIDNEMYLIADLMVKDIYNIDRINKRMNYVDSLITSLVKEISASNDKFKINSINIIADNYRLALEYARKYLSNRDTGDLINYIYYYTQGISTESIRKELGKA